MEFLKVIGEPVVLPPTPRLVMKEWLDNIPNVDLPISFLSGNGGDAWRDLIEEAAPSTTVLEYGIQKPCKYRYAVKGVLEMSGVCMTFSQVLAFLKLDRHIPGNQYQFYIGNHKDRRPLWDLDASLSRFSDGSIKWHLTIDIHFDDSDRWLGPPIIAPQ